MLTFRQLAWLFGAALLAAAGVIAFLPGGPLARFARHEPAMAPVPLGTTEQRTVVDAEGKPEVWTITKQEIPREELDDRAMPAPETPPAPAPEAATEQARTLDANAVEAWKHGDIKTALDQFEAAARVDPDHARSRSDYGRLLTLMGAYDKALPHLERAAKLDPENPQVWLDLLSYYERTTQLERALYARQRAEQRANGRALARDPSGLWVLEGDSILP